MSKVTLSDESMGRVVREVWVKWCQERRDRGEVVPDHHFVPYEDMPDPIKEIDNRIGAAVREATVLGISELFRAVKNG